MNKWVKYGLIGLVIFVLWKTVLRGQASAIGTYA